MAKYRNSLKKAAIICQALEWKAMSKKELQDHLFDKMGDYNCESTIEKILYFLRNEFDAPITFNRHKGKYYFSEPYKFIDGLIQYLSV